MDDSSSRPDRLKTRPAQSSLDSPVVVIGIDGSATSWDAFWWGCGETLRLGGRAVVVYVSPIAEISAAAVAAAVPGVMVDYREVERADNDQAALLAAQVSDYAGARGVPASFLHTNGDPASELARVAGELHAEVIVVGRSAKARHRVAGSIGRCLVNRKGTPVVVVVP
jgi:nucleotide-binding universal stress UspA family protein